MAIEYSPMDKQTPVKPIAFTLHNKRTSARITIPLNIRPEELSITYPSRMAVTHTFGEDGAWADSFGQGMKTITLSGVTGWRGTLGTPNGESGEALFVNLHNLVMTAWHLMRDVESKGGNDPDQVLLVLSDGLDNLNWVVAPQQFVLKRNKSRPLMAQYNISLQRLRDADPEYAPKPPTADAAKKLATTSISSGISQLSDWVADLKKFVKGVVGAIKDVVKKVIGFINMAKNLLTSVVNAVKGVVGFVSEMTSDLISLAKDISHAGMNLAMTLAAITTFPQQIRALFQNVGSAFTNMLCVLSNVFKKKTFLPEFDASGSGSCASTSGGSSISPYVSSNTFAAALSEKKSPVVISDAASNSLKTVLNNDPVQSPMTATSCAYHADTLGMGVLLA